jgi:hypothetical protein
VKVATVGLAIITLVVIYLVYLAWGSWTWAPFLCSGTYWECHRKAVPEVAIFGFIPLIVWATCLWLFLRAWKRR